MKKKKIDLSKWAITCATPHFTNQCELWRKASAEKNTNISLQSMREVRTNNAFQEKKNKKKEVYCQIMT